MTGTIFARLPRLSDHIRGPELDAALLAVGRYMADHGLTERYAIQLLHGHFSVAYNEAIVEWIDGDVLRTEVVSRDEIVGRTPSQWGVTADGQLVELQWSRDALGSAEEDTGLVELGLFLASQALHRTFAIETLPYGLPTGPDKVTFEDTDEVARTQTTIVVPRSAVKATQAAGWKFSEDGLPFAVPYCNDYEVRH
jgi:hypothetical protein